MKKRTDLQKQEERTAYLFLLPSIAGFLVFMAYPAVLGLLLSFTNTNNLNSPLNFIGLANFRKLLHDNYFLISLKNNIFYMLSFTPMVVAVSLLFAIILNRNILCRKFFRTVFFFPFISSMVAVAIIWNYILSPNGPVNGFLISLGVESPPGWLLSKDWAMFAVVVISVWKEFGFYMVILLAGLQTIPEYLYEAAVIDGVKPWQKFRYITLPMVSPTMFLCIIMAVISSFQVFDLVNVLTEGGPGNATNVLVFRIYREGFANVKMGYASSIALVLFVIVFVFSLIQFKLQDKWVNYNQ